MNLSTKELAPCKLSHICRCGFKNNDFVEHVQKVLLFVPFIYFQSALIEWSSWKLSNSSCQFWNDKSIPIEILHHSSLSWHTAPLQILSSYILYFGWKNPIKVPILRLSSALSKICQISHVIFASTRQFSFKCCISLHCYQT